MIKANAATLAIVALVTRWRRRTPDTYIKRKTDRAITIIVPRSRWNRMRIATLPTMRAMGTAHRIGWSSLRTFRARTEDTATTTTNFASSEGCMLKDPRFTQREAPPEVTPA